MSHTAKQTIRYLPWKGPQYGASSQFGMGILVLGESHYDYEGCIDDHYLTQRVFGGSPDEGIRNPFRRAVAEIVLGQSPIDTVEYENFWQSVGMYNYVRRLLSKGEKVKPKDLRDMDAANAFKEVLRLLQPSCVFVFSRRVWNCGRPDFDRTDTEIGKELGCEAGWYDCGSGRDALAVGLRHPSYSKFSGDSSLSQHKFVAKSLLALSQRRAS